MTVEEACLVLGIEKPNITEEELKHKFYDAAHLSHPDSNPFNEYAKTKFAMVQEAYLVLKGYVIELPSNKAEDTSTNEKKKEEYKDPWDAYNEADKRFAQMKREHAKKKAREAFARKEAEDLRRQKEAETKMNTTSSGVTVAAMKAHVPATSVVQAKYLVFMEKDILFDSLLAFSIAMLILSILLNLPFIGSMFSWSVSILIGRRVGKSVYLIKKSVILSLITLLVMVEILMVLFKIFLL